MYTTAAAGVNPDRVGGLGQLSSSCVSSEIDGFGCLACVYTVLRDLLDWAGRMVGESLSATRVDAVSILAISGEAARADVAAGQSLVRASHACVDAAA